MPKGPPAKLELTNSAAADIARAKQLAEQAVVASPRSALAHFAKGQVLRVQRRNEEAIPRTLRIETLLPGSGRPAGWVVRFLSPQEPKKDGAELECPTPEGRKGLGEQGDN